MTRSLKALSPAEHRTIHRLAHQGLSLGHIAKQWNISTTSVAQIRDGKWRSGTTGISTVSGVTTNDPWKRLSR
jgi:hypothetical protein